MKKSILFTLALLIGFTTLTQAQNDDYRMNGALSVNYTFTGALFNTAQDAAIATLGAENTAKKNIPSVQLSFDYGLTKWLSIGAAVSYQKLGLDVTGATYTDGNNEVQTEDFTADFTRTSIALRPLFHYANNDRLDMYSGLRIQYFSGNYEDTSENPDTETVLDFPTKTGIGVGIVAYGIRYYVTDNIGLGYELNIGRPYVSNLSINARF